MADIKDFPKKSERTILSTQSTWPVSFQWSPVKWYPANSRLIGLVRNNVDNFVLPPAVVRKAAWRD
ncbi:MAG: hypothetical protein K9M57_09165 [Phycisphaerae bacterium]|nr:hypothetical protein [Phycisphaerae bacterium]